MSRCAVHVVRKDGALPAQCHQTRDVKRVQLRDTPVLACATHRRLILGGRHVRIAEKAR